MRPTSFSRVIVTLAASMLAGAAAAQSVDPESRKQHSTVKTQPMGGRIVEDPGRITTPGEPRAGRPGPAMQDAKTGTTRSNERQASKDLKVEGARGASGRTTYGGGQATPNASTSSSSRASPDRGTDAGRVFESR